MNEPESLKNALRKLYKENLSNLLPHPLYSAFYYREFKVIRYAIRSIYCLIIYVFIYDRFLSQGNDSVFVVVKPKLI